MVVSADLVRELDAVGDWGLLATDAGLVVTGWNRWLERASGWPAAAVLGRGLLDLFPDLAARGLERYYRQALAGQTAILSQQFHKYVLPIPTPVPGAPQSLMQQSVRVLPLVTGVNAGGTLTLVADVTERVVRDAELRARGRQQASLAQSARAALAGHDIVELCGDAVRRLAETVGAELAEVLELLPGGGEWGRLAGSGWAEPSALLRPGTSPRIDTALRSEGAVALGDPGGGAPLDPDLKAAGAASGLVVRIPGRGPRPFGLLGAYTHAPRRFTPDEIQYAQALADVIGSAVERKRLETELRLRAKELADADRRKDEFLAMLAHELRNPLAPVRNAVYVLQSTKSDDPDVARLTGILGRQVGQMAHLVDDLLDVSRLTSGKVTLHRERVALADAIARAVETARPLIESRRHELIVSVPPDPIPLDADPTRLTQIFGNLLNNAAKYTDPGGRIELSAAREGGGAVVRVRDNGIGLSPEMLLRAFDLFTQEPRTLDRAQGGLGIGLTLVRNLVELHGGSVEAHSAGPGRGSEFVVRLPALGTGTAGTRPNGEPTHAAPATHRLLIVDDNVDSAESLAELLSLSGHTVRTAHDGPAALRDAAAHPPGVVLLDIGLPRMSGYEVATRLRQIPGLRDVTLIAMTGYGQDDDRRRSQEAGFNHHLVKPVDLNEVTALLQSIPASPHTL
ncbi:Autoinducer 2 sensor kinase/phosphatase LuxQ [Gemmata obscuriglobus]|uniref:histidine kinase n=1 Tax=Gemmata obscuriglobus TaxID=114 RepID=A0A2Z3GQN4_9BACT|nr:ATP-binding protein [Gemmata obscuriglobus]AWM35598.1 hybrid sensor histidine kinase/response regulator [Gemmata obscuriglobus]QEG31879.1 Autoinducer 2 sensor kinase/phosphatase LuxQ [Gemmata obscuriglobus]VTS11225.1 histidine kinase : Chemotaxis protein methyltransferase CheR OS=Chondromyces apiculatus DSM 436 GN=CAP_7340 PE=4 SV=1: PAS_4: GAF_2: HisKA: HATPase_c: Response_reg [Gemmata obscuriglobus UQM 2246]